MRGGDKMKRLLDAMPCHENGKVALYESRSSLKNFSIWSIPHREQKLRVQVFFTLYLP